PGPVRALRIAQLEAETPVVGLHATETGQHAVQSGELDARRLGEQLRREPGWAQQLVRDREELAERPLEPEGRRASEGEAPHLLEVRRERHLGPLADERGRELEAAVRID